MKYKGKVEYMKVFSLLLLVILFSSGGMEWGVGKKRGD